MPMKERTIAPVRKIPKKEKEELAQKHYGLIMKIARIYARQCRRLQIADLAQEGRIGLWFAAAHYDGVRHFPAYAAIAISRAMKRAISRQEPTIYLPPCAKKRGAHVSSRTGDRGDFNILKLVPTGQPSTEKRWVDTELLLVLRELIKKRLKPRERYVVRLKMGLGRAAPHTFEEIAKRLHITRAGAKYIFDKSITKLRKALA